MCQENLSQQERRRSARLIAQEERRENERKTMQGNAKNKSKNLEATKKDKGKKVMVADDDFMDEFDSEDERNVSTRKRGRKRRTLNQLVSSTLGGLYRETGIYDLNDVPQKHVFEFVVDILQRIDRNDYFAQPVNPDEVEGYYDVIKQPMDFGTMRAKLQENIYTNLEELENDVNLMCNNAMTFNARNTVYYKVASIIMDRAGSIFAGLRANPEHIDLGIKKRGRRRPQGRSYRSVPFPTRHSGKSYGAHLEVEERRNTYSPPEDNSLASQLFQGPKQNFILNIEALPCYEESLTNFGKGLGPVAQQIIKRKLETLRLFKLVSGETTSQNHNQNQASSSSNQGITRQRQQIPQATPAQHQASSNDLVLSHTQQLSRLSHTQQLSPLSHTQKPNPISHTQQLSPLSHTQQPNPISHTQQLNPLSHTQQLNPLSHTQQFNPLSHTQQLNPFSHTQQFNPLSHTQQLNPLSHSEQLNPLSHTQQLHPLSHTQQLSPQAKSTDNQHQASCSNVMLPHTQQLAPQATKTQHQASYIDLMLSPTQQLSDQAKPTRQHQASYSDLSLPRTKLLTPQATATQHQASYSDLLLAPSHQLTTSQAARTQQNEASYNDIMLSHTRQLTHQATPTLRQEPSYTDVLFSNALPLSNRSLRIPGAAATPQNRNTDTNKQQGTSVRDKGKGILIDKGKTICIDENNYNAAAAALLGSIFQKYAKGQGGNVNQGEASSSSSIRRPLQYDLNSDVNISDPRLDQMVLSFGNEAPSQVYDQASILQQNRDLLQLSAYKNNASSGQCSNPPEMSDTLQSHNLGRPSRVRSRVWPTRVISGPQPNQSQSRYGQSVLSQPFLPNNYQADYSYGNNYSVPSQLSHRRSSIELMSATNSRRQAILCPQATDRTSWLSSPSQPQNFQELLGFSYNRSQPTELMSATNSRKQTILLPKDTDHTSWLSSPNQPENFQQLLGSSYNSNPLSELNRHGNAGNAGTDQAIPSYGYGGMGPTSLNSYGRRASLQGRTQEGAITQLLWEENDHPELALQL